MRGNLLRICGMTVGSLILCGAALAQVGASCGPVATNPPPVENPSISVTKSITASTWNAAYYEWTISVIAQNTGNVKLTSFALTDSANIPAYIPNGTWSKISGPTLVLGNASLAVNASWDGAAGANAQLLTSSAPDSIGIGETVVVQYVCRVTHGGATGPWLDRAWGRGTSPASAVVVDDALITLTPPVAPETPTIGIAKYFGAVTGTAPNFSAPCTLIVKNLGNVTINQIDVRDTVANAFAGISGASLTSITGKSSRRFTFKSTFNGTSAHDSCLSIVAGDSLRIASTGTASTDTLAFTVNFNAGTGTSFSNSARAVAKNLANTITTSDVSDWGTNPDPSGNGDPSDPGESDASQFSIPATATGNPDLVMDASGATVFNVPFAEGAMPVATITGAGTGLAIQVDGGGAVLPTQCEVFNTWGDGSVRNLTMAAVVTGGTTYDVVSATQTGSAVTITEPICDVLLNGTTYDFTLADAVAASPIPADGRVWRRAQITKTDGSPDFCVSGSCGPGGLKIIMDVWWFSDGTQRVIVRVRNQNMTSAGVNIWDYGQASDEAADITIVRDDGAATMLMRDAVASGMSAGNQSSLHVWHSGTYSHCEGSQYNFGGIIRCGEDLAVMVTSSTTEEAPKAMFAPAYVDLTSGAIPRTANMHIYGATFASADSIVCLTETRNRVLTLNLDGLSPFNAASQTNIRDLGGVVRQEDMGNETPAGCGHHFDMGQYGLQAGLLVQWLGLVRNAADTVAAYPTWDNESWEHARRGSWHQCNVGRYHLQYGVERAIWGMQCAHVAHNNDGKQQQGRGGGSGANPTLQYGHGESQGLMAVLTREKPYEDAMLDMQQHLEYAYSTRTGGAGSLWSANIVNGEGRWQAGFFRWVAMALAMTSGDSLYATIGMEGMRAWSDRFDFDVLPGELLNQNCASFSGWCNGKGWMIAQAVLELREMMRELRAYGFNGEADEAAAIVSEFQSVLYRNAWAPDVVQNDRSLNYPACAGPDVPTAMPDHIWQWRTIGDVSERTNFWLALHGSMISGYQADPIEYRRLWQWGVRHFSDTNETEYIACFDDNRGYMPAVVVLNWGLDAMREHDGALDTGSQERQTSEVIWDD